MRARRDYVSREDLLKGCEKIGSAVIRWAINGGGARCSALLKLAKGTILATFKGGPADHGTLSVVGGSGVYAHASGAGTFRNLDAQGHRSAVTLLLS
jgi:hypothetical protein